MTLLITAQVQAIDHVENLTKQHTILHILVGILEGSADNRTTHWRIGCYLQFLQGGEQRIVHKVEQLVSRQSLARTVIFRPVAPTAVFRDKGCIVVFVELPIVFFFVVNFQKEHPCDLFDSLGIAIDTCIITHDVSDVLYKICYCHF